MDTVYLMDEKEMKKAKSARLLAIIALVCSGAYILEGITSVLLALIPIPILGFFISVFLSIIEFFLLIASIVFIIIALVKKSKVKKELSQFADSPEKQEALNCLNTASILSYVALGITALAFCILCVLNVVEFFLSLF